MATGRVPTTANSPLTAKGDLFGYSTTQARVPVGNNGETIVADSSTSTGLRYTATNAAGKNAVINGAFEVWQRGTSFTATGYSADRWYVTTPGSNTWSRSTDCPSGFNYSMNWASAGSYPGLFNYVELPVAGAKGNFVGTWVYSFYAKASTATTLGLSIQWMDGSSRANNVAITQSASSVSLTTSWQRFSVTVDFNSSSPVGTNKAIEIGYFLATGGATVNITGCQLEIGSVATAFTRTGGTIQGELDSCMRYAINLNYNPAGKAAYNTIANGYASSTTAARIAVNLPVAMRTQPSSVTTSGNFVLDNTASFPAVTSITINQGGTTTVLLTANVASGLTSGQNLTLYANNDATASVILSAEL